MTRLYLVRHGEVDQQGIFYGQLDVELSDAGERQARGVAATLADQPLDRVCASDLRRAARGAELIAGHQGLEPQLDPAFREMNLGTLEGLPYDEARRTQPELASRSYRDMWDHRFPAGGENLQDIADRAMPALDQLLQAHPRGMLALVAHNSTNRVIIGLALGLALKDVFDFAQDFGCINCIDYEPWQGRRPRARVTLLNWTPEAPCKAR